MTLDEILKNNLISNFTNAIYDNGGEISDYILRIVQIATSLKDLNLSITDDFLVHHVSNSLRIELEQLRIS